MFRSWELACSKLVSVDTGTDFEKLARLDLAGAGIASTVRMSALLAAYTVSDVHAITRQYWREIRLLTALEFEPYAIYLQEAK